MKLGSPSREMQPRTHRWAYTFQGPVAKATPGGSSDPSAVSQTFLCPRTTWERGLGRGRCSRPLLVTQLKVQVSAQGGAGGRLAGRLGRGSGCGGSACPSLPGGGERRGGTGTGWGERHAGGCSQDLRGTQERLRSDSGPERQAAKEGPSERGRQSGVEEAESGAARRQRPQRERQGNTHAHVYTRTHVYSRTHTPRPGSWKER